jgi:predicted RNase H-like HicB family nuclease
MRGFLIRKEIYELYTAFHKEVKMRQVIVYSGEDGYFIAECPSLPGCISQGQTREEAVVNIKEAINGYIAALKEDGLPVPEENFSAMVVAV